MKADFMKIVRAVTIYAVHLISGISIQAMLLAVIIWYYDTGVEAYASYTLLTFALLSADFFVSSLLQRGMAGRTNAKRLLHLPDLIFAIPNILIAFKELFSFQNMETLPACAVVLAINVLLASERIILIEKTLPRLRAGT